MEIILNLNDIEAKKLAVYKWYCENIEDMITKETSINPETYDVFLKNYYKSVIVNDITHSLIALYDKETQDIKIIEIENIEAKRVADLALIASTISSSIS